MGCCTAQRISLACAHRVQFLQCSIDGGERVEAEAVVGNCVNPSGCAVGDKLSDGRHAKSREERRKIGHTARQQVYPAGKVTRRQIPACNP